jgi:hypothetical protein
MVGMRLKDVDQDLPILLFYSDRVIRNGRPLAPKQNLPDAQSRFISADAELQRHGQGVGVTPTALDEIVYMAFRTAHKFAGLRYIKSDEE